MATIGLDMLHYAKITEDENGNESYGTPQKLAKAMSADLSVELAHKLVVKFDKFGSKTLLAKFAKLTKE